MNTGEHGDRGHEDRFRKLEESYQSYTVYDQHYEKIGKVDDLFVDENDQPEYIGVKTGFLGMKSTLIPMEIARINDRRNLIEVAADRDAIKDAPSFDDDEEMTPDREHRIHAYFGLERPGSWDERGGYGDYYHSGSDAEDFTREDLTGAVDTDYGERRDETPDRPVESGPLREERREAHASRPAEPGREDLDIPLEDTERREPGEETTEPRRDTVNADATARTEEGGHAFSDEGEVRGMRVHKRVRPRSG